MFKLVDDRIEKFRELKKKIDSSLKNNNTVEKSKYKKQIEKTQKLKEFLSLKTKDKKVKGNFSKIQSPKLRNNMYRSNSQPEFVTTINNSKSFNSKGTNFPGQFSRDNYNDLFNLNKTFQNSFNSDDEALNKNLIVNINNLFPPKKKMTKSNSTDDMNIKTDRTRKYLNTTGYKERVYKPYLWDNLNKTELTNQRDSLMPEGFEFHEKLMKKEEKNYFKNNCVTVKTRNKKNNEGKKDFEYPIFIRKLLHEKTYQSDIFFKNENFSELYDERTGISKTKKFLKEFVSSDIFNKKINPFIIGKSGEKRFFKDQIEKENNAKKIKYNVSAESSGGFGFRDSLPSLLNYSSSNYNPLNPSSKNCCKTKEEIIKECDMNYNGFNPSNKQKSLSEFIVVTRVSAPNKNKDYTDAFNKDPKLFRRNDDMFTELYSLHSKYNTITDKPFQKLLVPLKDI